MNGLKIEARWLIERLEKYLYLLQIDCNRVRVVDEVKWQHRRVGKSQNTRSHGLGKRANMGKVCVRESCIPIERVIFRMVDAATSTVTAKAKIQRGNGQMIEKHRVIRT